MTQILLTKETCEDPLADKSVFTLYTIKLIVGNSGKPLIVQSNLQFELDILTHLDLC